MLDVLENKPGQHGSRREMKEAFDFLQRSSVGNSLLSTVASNQKRGSSTMQTEYTQQRDH